MAFKCLVVHLRVFLGQRTGFTCFNINEMVPCCKFVSSGHILIQFGLSKLPESGEDLLEETHRNQMTFPRLEPTFLRLTEHL